MRLPGARVRAGLLALVLLAAAALPDALCQQAAQPAGAAARGNPASMPSAILSALAEARDGAPGAAQAAPAAAGPAPASAAGATALASAQQAGEEAEAPAPAVGAADLASKTCKHGKNKKGKCRKKAKAKKAKGKSTTSSTGTSVAAPAGSAKAPASQPDDARGRSSAPAAGMKATSPGTQGVVAGSSGSDGIRGGASAKGSTPGIQPAASAQGQAAPKFSSGGAQATAKPPAPKFSAAGAQAGASPTFSAGGAQAGAAPTYSTGVAAPKAPAGASWAAGSATAKAGGPAAAMPVSMAAGSGSRKVRAGDDGAAATKITPAADTAAATLTATADAGTAPVAAPAAPAAPARVAGAANAAAGGVYNPGNRQATMRVVADPAGQAAPACGKSHVQAFTAELGSSGDARPQGSVRFFLVGPITDDLGTVQARARALLPHAPLPGGPRLTAGMPGQAMGEAPGSACPEMLPHALCTCLKHCCMQSARAYVRPVLMRRPLLVKRAEQGPCIQHEGGQASCSLMEAPMNARLSRHAPPMYLSWAAAPAQVVAPSGGSKGDNYARIVVDLHLKSAGTYSVRAPASAPSAQSRSFHHSPSIHLAPLLRETA